MNLCICSRYPKICLMTHSWVVEEWLPSIALMCYLPSFSEHLVDGRVLDTLTKKDLEKYFGITRKFHQLSILHGIQLLRMLNFDRQVSFACNVHVISFFIRKVQLTSLRTKVDLIGVRIGMSLSDWLEKREID